MENTWLVPFTKEIGLPALMAITFIWYFVRVFFPEQKAMMLDTVKLLTAQFEKSLLQIQEFHEKMLKEVLNHNVNIHNSLNKRIEGVIVEIVELREEVSRRFNDVSSKFSIAKENPPREDIEVISYPIETEKESLPPLNNTH